MKVLFLCISLLVSCAEDIASNNKSVASQSENETPVFTSFETRLNNTLLVKGTKCFGGEAADSEGQTYLCDAGNWLVTVDSVNICSPEGCTDILVQPFLAELNASTGDNETTFYEITALIPVSSEIEDILEGVVVRSRSDSAPVVIFQ